MLETSKVSFNRQSIVYIIKYTHIVTKLFYVLCYCLSNAYLYKYVSKTM